MGHNLMCLVQITTPPILLYPHLINLSLLSRILILTTILLLRNLSLASIPLYQALRLSTTLLIPFQIQLNHIQNQLNHVVIVAHLRTVQLGRLPGRPAMVQNQFLHTLLPLRTAAPSLTLTIQTRTCKLLQLQFSVLDVQTAFRKCTMRVRECILQPTH